MKPTHLSEIESTSQNMYADIYSKYNDQTIFLRKILIPYKCYKIHFCGSARKDLMIEEEKLKNSKKNAKNSKKILKIALSKNQKKMYTLNKSSELYQWYNKF